MPYTDAAKSNMLTSLSAAAVFASLHTSFPGTGGANEVSGGTPAYTRQAITWGAPASGDMAAATNPVFNVPAGTTVQYAGLWSLVTAGTFYGSMALGSGIPVAFEADPATDVITAEGHGLSNGQQVVFFHTQSLSVPSPLVEGTAYFVVNSTSTTFKVSATSGGAAIDLTTVGAGFVTTIIPETFGAQGTFTLTAAHLNLND